MAEEQNISENLSVASCVGRKKCCYRSRWYSKQNIEELYPRLKKGDLLEYNRQGYSHWAIYVGEENLIVEDTESLEHCIIHVVLIESENQKNLVRESSKQPWSKSFSQIQMGSIKSALDDDIVRLNNDLEIRFGWRPRDSEEIVLVAKKYMEESHSNVPQKGYNLFVNNCEHLANRCRYGRIYSRQVRETGKKLALSFGTVMIVVARIAAPIATVFCPPVAIPAIAAGAAATFVIPPIIHGINSQNTHLKHK